MYGVLKEHPEMQVVSQQATGYDANKANAIMQTVLQQHPDLCGSMGIWDNMDVGTGSAVQQAGKQGQVYVVSTTAGSAIGCENVKRGLFSALLSFNAPLQGQLVNERIAELLSNNQAAGATKTTFFTPLSWTEKDDLSSRRCWTPEDLKK
jgi:ribose transport system substrate-binding protein